MARSMPSSGRPKSPTAPTRRELQKSLNSSPASPDSYDSSSASGDSASTTRSAALERRRALTTSGKAAVLNQGSVAAGRIRSGRDQRRSESQQPVWIRRDQKSARASASSSAASGARSSSPRGRGLSSGHPLTNASENARLQAYELEVKGRFDRIVPVLQKVSALQHQADFIPQAQRVARAELGFHLPDHILEKSWVCPLDMRALFAWCVFESH